MVERLVNKSSRDDYELSRGKVRSRRERVAPPAAIRPGGRLRLRSGKGRKRVVKEREMSVGRELYLREATMRSGISSGGTGRLYR